MDIGDPYYDKAAAYYKSGEYDKAEEWYRAALSAQRRVEGEVYSKMERKRETERKFKEDIQESCQIISYNRSGYGCGKNIR